MRLDTKAEAVFLSSLQPSDHPTAAEVMGAVRRSLRLHGGASGCIADFAAEYGEHPEESAARMRWALSLVAGAAIAKAA